MACHSQKKDWEKYCPGRGSVHEKLDSEPEEVKRLAGRKQSVNCIGIEIISGLKEPKRTPLTWLIPLRRGEGPSFTTRFAALQYKLL